MMKKRNRLWTMATAVCVFALTLFAGLATVTYPNATAATTTESGLTVYEDSELETYSVVQNDDIGAVLTVSHDNTNYKDYYYTTSNSTTSMAYKFYYTMNDTNSKYIGLRGTSWNGYTFIFTKGVIQTPEGTSVEGVSMDVGNTYLVELGAIDIVDTTNTWVYVKVANEFVYSSTVANNATVGNAICMWGADGGASTLSQVSLYEDSELETYDTLYNIDWGLSETWTTTNDTFISFAPSAENTTGSFVWKFDYTAVDISTGINIYPLSAVPWRGSDHVELNGAGGWTAGETYEVEFGLIKIKNSENYYLSIRVDGLLKYTGTRTIAHNANCTSAGCTDDSAHLTGLYFYVAAGSGTLTSVKPIEYARYVVLQNDDIGAAASICHTNNNTAAYTYATTDDTTSVAYKFVYKVNNTDALYLGLRSSDDWGNNAYQFIFVSGQVQSPAGTVTNLFTVGNSYVVEIGAVDVLNSAQVWTYVKVSDQIVVEGLVSAKTGGSNKIGMWGSTSATSTLSQYSWDVTFTGVETREILVGNAIGALPDAPASEYEFNNWTDQDGNAVTADTVPTKNLTVTPNYFITYNVTFVVDGETVETRTDVAEGSLVGALPNAPEKSNGLFTGWTDQDGNAVTAETALTKDLTVTAQYEVTETYDVLDNFHWGLSEKWTTADNTFLQFTPSAENTTGSFVWKFKYTPTQTTGGLHIYPLSAAAWRGANPVNLNGISWTAGNTYEVEFGVVKLASSNNYTVFVNVDGERKLSSTDVVTHNANCTSAGCSDDAAHLNGIYFYLAGGLGVIQGQPLEYEAYETVQNADLGLDSEAVLAAGAETTLTFTGDATNGSLAYKFYIDVADTSSTTLQIQLRGGYWAGYVFNMAGSLIRIVHNNENYGQVAVDASLTDCLMEIGAIDIKGTNQVYLYWKVNGEEKISLLTDKVADYVNNSVFIYNTNEVTLSQYSYTVSFGTETKEVLVGEAVGALPTPTDVPANGYAFDKWVDQAGNEIATDTLLNGDCVATAQYVYHYTIQNNDGAVIASGAHIYGTPLAYDGNTLTDESNVFVGYFVGETLYKSIDAAVLESAETNVVMVAKTVGLGLVDGASIRLSSTNASIRFTTAIDITDADGTIVKDFGVLLTTEENRRAVNEFTLDGLSGLAEGTDYYNLTKSSGMRYLTNSEYPDQYVYSIIFDYISKSNYGVSYTARAYVLVEYTDGTQAYVYNRFDEAEHIRSMYDVANMAIVDTEENYADSQKAIIQKYIDGIIALDENLELTGEARNYTVSISGMDADGAYTVTVTPKNGFAISGIGAIYVEGEKVSVYEANAAAGTFKIKEADMNANTLAAFNRAMEKANDITALQISAYSGPQFGTYIDLQDDGTLVTEYGDFALEYTHLKEYMDAGFTAWRTEISCLQSETGYTAKGTTYQGDTPTYDVYHALDLAAQYAAETGKPCPVYINIPQLSGTVELTDSVKSTISLIYKIFTNYDDGSTTVANSPVNGINQLGGFILKDEPTIADYDAFAASYNYIAYEVGAIADGYDFSVALLQTYADEDKLGGTYAAYVEKFATLLKDTNVSFDNYPFKYKNPFIGNDEYTMETSWYSDMQTVRAQENGNGTCIQSYTAGDTSDTLNRYPYKKISSEAEISMQVYTALAYGFTHLDYFCYWQPYNTMYQYESGATGEVFQETPIMWNGDYTNGDTWDMSAGYTKTNMYTWISNTNAEANALYRVLSKFTSNGVQLINGTTSGTNDFGSATTTNTTNTITVSATYDMVVGGFSADGYNGYLAVNVDFPADSGTRTNTATFTVGNSYTKAIVYVNGEAEVVRVTNGTLSLDIGCGEGVFIVPLA